MTGSARITPVDGGEMVDLRITYDQESDIAYLVLNGELPRTDDSRICEEVGDPAETVLDMDESGRLIGIEIRNAGRRLPETLLLEAEPGPPPS
jgi:uncharacterized protein YuzE